MTPSGKTADEIREKIAETEEELQKLKDQLAQAEATERAVEAATTAWKWPLEEQEYERYGRQLILPTIGTHGQLQLKNASVLIIGAGGLGCPAAAYLAGAGVGHIGVVDGDTVESSNLHRQIAHSTDRIGKSKAHSLVAYMRSLNELPTYTAHPEHLTTANALELVGSYSLVLDCTDHPAIRYLISDACVLAGKPLVSAAALRTDGQLVVLNSPAGVGPCYRCVFPRPPPQASQMSCSEGGILGPVVGVMGVLQALEAVRVIVSSPKEDTKEPPANPSLLLFNAAGGGSLVPSSFRSVRLRGRRPDCFACSGESQLRKLRAAKEWPDYVMFCGGDSRADLVPLSDNERISPVGLHQRLGGAQPHWLLDVREKEFFDMASIDGSINIPFSQIQSAVSRKGGKRASGQSDPSSKEAPSWLPKEISTDEAPIYIVCRVGNDSQVVTRYLKEAWVSSNGQRFIGDLRGGIRAWKKDVDKSIPFA